MGSWPGKSITNPLHGRISRRMPTFGDRGAVAMGNGDSSIMLTSSLTGCMVSSTAMGLTMGHLVAAARDVFWAGASLVWSAAWSFAESEEAMVTVSVGGVAATGVLLWVM
uniref:Uncharacterized protein n=1 Tax=Romanomermis culicivorax TaxID=13658 RepID=A0A915IX07_ROMCU